MSRERRDREVSRIAASWCRLGYDVDAAASGFTPPRAIRAVIPDVIARGGGLVIAVLVVGPRREALAAALACRLTLCEWAEAARGREFYYVRLAARGGGEVAARRYWRPPMSW